MRASSSVCACSRACRIMIIIDFVVLGQAPGQIGAPKWFPGSVGMGGGMDGGMGGGMGMGAPAGPAGAGMGMGGMGGAGGMGMGSSGVAGAPGMGPMGGAGGMGGGVGGMRPTSIGSMGTPMGGRPAGSMGPTVGAAAPSHFTPIAALTTFNQRWTLKARVVAKSDVRSWNNPKGSGTLFSITLADEGGAEIRGTFFKDAVTKFYDRIQVGKVYTVSGGKVKMANQAYTSVKNECEITFDDKTVITEVADDARIARVVFNFVKLSALEAVEPGKMVDVVGVVTAAPDTATIPSKKNPGGEPLTKRDLTLADDSGAAITLTLWGDTARSLPVGVSRSRESGVCVLPCVLQSGVRVRAACASLARLPAPSPHIVPPAVLLRPHLPLLPRPPSPTACRWAPSWPSRA